MKKFNYVYCITELNTNMQYIGSTSCNIHPSQHLGIKYFGSRCDNKVFENKQRETPSNYKYEIIKIYNNRLDAYAEESRLHYLYDVKNNPIYYNQANTRPDGTNDTSGFMNAYCNGLLEYVSINDPRFLTGELIPLNIGMVTVKDHNGETMQMNVNDDRFNTTHFSVNRDKMVATNGIETIQLDINDYRIISGEYWSIHRGKVTVKDQHGNTLMVPTDHPEYINGSLKHISTGMCTVTYNNQSFRVSTDDHRITTGEFKHINTGKVAVLNDQGDIEQIDANDQRYIDGTLKHIAHHYIHVKNNDGVVEYLRRDDVRIIQEDLKPLLTGMVMVKDQYNNVSRVNINDPDYINGSLKPIAKGRVNVKDLFGNRFQVDIDDPRYLNNELFPVNAKLISYYNNVYTMKQLTSLLSMSSRTINKMCHSGTNPHLFFLP